MLCLEETVIGNGLYQSYPVVDIAQCVYVLATPQDIALNKFSLTADQGLQIASAIGILWATAYAFRVISQFFKSLSNQEE